MAAWDGGPCIWQRTPGKSLCPVSGVRSEFEALPKSGCHDSWFESDNLPRNTRTPRPAVANLPSPVQPKSLTMPTDHGFRFDDDQGRAPTRPQARKPNPKTSTSSAEDETVCLLSSLQHDQLMTERDDLGPHHRLTLNAG